jgi:hypothetical protein
VGTSISKDTDAFKKIQKYSKIASSNVSQDILNNSNRFEKINNLYLNVNHLNNDSYNYGIHRQHNFASLNSTLPSYSTLVDKNSLNKFFQYSLSVNTENSKKLSETMISSQASHNSLKEHNNEINKYSNTIINKVDSNLFLNKWLNKYNVTNNLSNTTDSKKNDNPLLSFNSSNMNKKNVMKPTNNNNFNNELVTNLRNTYFS